MLGAPLHTKVLPSDRSRMLLKTRLSASLSVKWCVPDGTLFSKASRSRMRQLVYTVRLSNRMVSRQKKYLSGVNLLLEYC